MGMKQEFYWQKLWQEARANKSWRAKSSVDWDKKAESFAERTATSIYVDKFISLLRPAKGWSVLDVGSGPGTLAVPLAGKVAGVSCLDFSEKMLAILSRRAEAEGIDNIRTHHLSWEDDWQEAGINVHDVVIASRSLSVSDLASSLLKISGFARKMVVVTDRVGSGPFDVAAFAAVGRDFKPGPDCCYTIAMLLEMGFLPRVDYIVLEKTMQYQDMEEALQSYLWMFKEISELEKKRLVAYIESISEVAGNGQVLVTRPQPPVWAFISWKPDGTIDE